MTLDFLNPDDKFLILSKKIAKNSNCIVTKNKKMAPKRKPTYELTVDKTKTKKPAKEKEIPELVSTVNHNLEITELLKRKNNF
jgi:hypothetical protein